MQPAVACLVNRTRREILIDADSLDAIPLAGAWWVSRLGYAFTKHENRSLMLARALMNAPADLCVDHINGNPSDNRMCNLRLCTHAENMRNRKLNRNNTTGMKGVCRYGDRFEARITANGKHIYLGTYRSAESAGAAYRAAADELHGQFRRGGAA